jgi:hypothetical protein
MKDFPEFMKSSGNYNSTSSQTQGVKGEYMMEQMTNKWHIGSVK